MKYFILFLVFTCAYPGISQKLKRKKFDYYKLEKDEYKSCDPGVIAELDACYSAIDQNNSKEAVELSKKIYSKNNDCFHTYELYGLSLFKSGEWLKGVEIIEKGIEKFGSVPELVKRRSEMSLEMAQLGTKKQVIDGNTVYKGGKGGLNYDEEQFVSENFASALTDLEFLYKTYNRPNEAFIIGKVHQVQENYEKSNEMLKTVVFDENFGTSARYEIAQNYIDLKKYDEAETQINELIQQIPEEPAFYKLMARMYEQKGDATAAKTFQQKAMFYKNVPAASGFEFSEENFNLLLYFGGEEQSAENKLKRLADLKQSKSDKEMTAICLAILKIHANHGNGVEEEAAKMLGQIGPSCLEAVHAMFLSNVSTCTITNLADVMATIKDEGSFEILTNYLPIIVNMPMTLIPPDVPEKLIAYDPVKGTKEVLKVAQQFLSKTKAKNDDPFGDLGGIFTEGVFFHPLKKLDHETVFNLAAEVGYNKEEMEKLKEKLKDK